MSEIDDSIAESALSTKPKVDVQLAPMSTTCLGARVMHILNAFRPHTGDRMQYGWERMDASGTRMQERRPNKNRSYCPLQYMVDSEVGLDPTEMVTGTVAYGEEQLARSFRHHGILCSEDADALISRRGLVLVASLLNHVEVSRPTAQECPRVNIRQRIFDQKKALTAICLTKEQEIQNQRAKLREGREQEAERRITELKESGQWDEESWYSEQWKISRQEKITDNAFETIAPFVRGLSELVSAETHKLHTYLIDSCKAASLYKHDMSGSRMVEALSKTHKGCSICWGPGKKASITAKTPYTEYRQRNCVWELM